MEFLDGEGGRGRTPEVEILGVVEALVGVKGLGWGWDVAQGAGSHEGFGAAGREDVAVVIAVNSGFAEAVGDESGFELCLDPGFAGGGFSEFGFECVFLVVGEAASGVAGGNWREG